MFYNIMSNFSSSDGQVTNRVHADDIRSLLRTRPDGIAICPGVCAGFALVVQVLSRLKQRNFQMYVEKHHFLGCTSADSKYNTLL